MLLYYMAGSLIPVVLSFRMFCNISRHVARVQGFVALISDSGSEFLIVLAF